MADWGSNTEQIVIYEEMVIYVKTLHEKSTLYISLDTQHY